MSCNNLTNLDTLSSTCVLSTCLLIPEWDCIGQSIQLQIYLGVTLTSDLSWSTHISNSCNKTRGLIGLLYRRFHQCANPPSLLRLYRSFIRPHLESSLQGEIDTLESVQKYALRICLKSWDSNYAELLAAADLPSLQKRCIPITVCHLYKIVNSLTDFPAPPVFPPDHFHKTRSSDKPAFIVPNLEQVPTSIRFFLTHSLYGIRSAESLSPIDVYRRHLDPMHL